MSDEQTPGKKSVHASTRRYGWRPSLPDQRDKYLRFGQSQIDALAGIDHVDLSADMPPCYDQGSLGSCHDDQTEILTQSGWKMFADITLDDKLATVDPQSKKLTYEKPARIIRKPYKGPMHYGVHQNIDFAVTPDHVMLVRKWDESLRTLSDEYSFVKAADIGWYSGLMAGVTRQAKSNPLYTIPGVTHKNSAQQREDLKVTRKAWLRFLGIYLAEGTMCKDAGKYKVQIAYGPDKEKEFLRQVCKDMHIHPCELKDRFTFDNKRLYLHMVDLGLLGVKTPFKSVPEHVFEEDAEHIKEFLLGHFMGDGCEQHGLRSHYTSSVQLADDLQRLALLSGGWSIIRSRPPRQSTMKDGRVIKGQYPEHRVGMWNTTQMSLDRAANIHIDEYEGEVFCAEVPTHHTLVTRRNGKILVAGNCTANAVAGVLQYDEIKQKLAVQTTPSRLFIYWNERYLDPYTSVTEDTGSTITMGIRACKTYGFADESDWPYNVQKFAVEAPGAVYASATKNRITDYARVNQTVQDLQAALAAGHPVAFGFSVYQSFESNAVAKNGIVPMPLRRERMVGGHATVLVGFDNTTQRFKVRNSWGPHWGDGGYFYLPYAYATNKNLSGDFWVINAIPQG